jgi:hypothetical protein
MKYLYKYPQAAYPYDDLVATNGQRGKHEPEYELLDTGVFDDNRYFDVFVEYAKAAPDDVLIRITACNRGPAAAPLRVLPTLWFRNTWSHTIGAARPALMQVACNGAAAVHARHGDPLPPGAPQDAYLYCDGNVPLLFTENETNNARLFGGENASPYVKDGINYRVVHGVCRSEGREPGAQGHQGSRRLSGGSRPGRSTWPPRIRAARARRSGHR